MASSDDSTTPYYATSEYKLIAYVSSSLAEVSVLARDMHDMVRVFARKRDPTRPYCPNLLRASALYLEQKSASVLKGDLPQPMPPSELETGDFSSSTTGNDVDNVAELTGLAHYMRQIVDTMHALEKTCRYLGVTPLE